MPPGLCESAPDPATSPPPQPKAKRKKRVRGRDGGLGHKAVLVAGACALLALGPWLLKQGRRWLQGRPLLQQGGAQAVQQRQLKGGQQAKGGGGAWPAGKGRFAR